MESPKPDMKAVEDVRRILEKKGMYDKKYIRELVEIYKVRKSKTHKLFFIKRWELTRKIDALNFILEGKTQPASESGPGE